MPVASAGSQPALPHLCPRALCGTCLPCSLPHPTSPCMCLDAPRRLLRKIAEAPFSRGLDAFALVDTSPPTLRWADGQFCSRSCRRGTCHALAKVARGQDGNAIRCGHRLGAYDAVVAGDVSVAHWKWPRGQQERARRRARSSLWASQKNQLVARQKYYWSGSRQKCYWS
jgi:hypothetical protein